MITRGITLSATSQKSGTAQRGFTLIEALIAFVILSVGLLGVVTLQTVAKTSQHQAIQRERAVGYADAVIERMRINPAGMTKYNTGLTNPVGTDPNAPEPNPDCSSVACDPNQLAVHDLWAWGQSLSGTIAKADYDGSNTSGLIAPRGCIVFNPVAGKTNTGRLNVIIEWRGLLQSQDAVQGASAVCGGNAAGADDYRRQISVNTFVVDESEF